MVDAFALVNRSRFDRGDILGELLDQFLGRGGNLADRVQVVVPQVDLIQSPGRGYFHFTAIR